jgi:hypothetical protein
LKKEIRVYALNKSAASIDQISIKRDWMDLTFDRHAYQCFPLSLANRLGWGISFPEDIVFIWDGVNDSTPGHVKIIKGERFVHPNRGNRTISFNTGLFFESNKNVSLLTMPVPNQFIDGATCMTTIISTSVLDNDLPIAWIITRPNIEITIPANTPIASIVPISLNSIQDYGLSLISGRPATWESEEWNVKMRDRARVSQEKNSTGDWTHFYRNTTNHLGDVVGEHEAKKIIMRVRHEKNN